MRATITLRPPMPYGMCLLWRDGFGGGVGGRGLLPSMAVTTLKFVACKYSYVVFVILVFVRVVVVLMLLLLVLLIWLNSAYPLGAQSREWDKLLKSVESRDLAGNGGGRMSSSDVESVVSTRN